MRCDNDLTTGCPLKVQRDLGEREQTHGDRDETDAVDQLRPIKREPGHARVDVRPDRPEKKPKKGHKDGFEHRTVGERHGRDQTQDHEGEVLRGVELERHVGERRRESGNHDRRDGPREE